MKRTAIAAAIAASCFTLAASNAIAASVDTSGLEGKQLLPRDVASALRDYWSNYELTKGIATVLSESQAFVGAYHTNEDAAGNVLSRDCGVFQINIAAKYIGTPVEFSLRTTSLDSAVYWPVVTNNVQAAWALYNQPWTRNGQPDIRRWQPWYGFTFGWATFPAFWLWKQTNGVPTGPWVRTGRYIHRAIVGQMNRHVVVVGDWSSAKALRYARAYAQHFGISPALLYVTGSGTVAWHVPPAPTSPPSDGIGPRPRMNDGQ
jgi:hypothetical protein